ncbi:hypothetical protein [Mesorhizobium sp. WSM4982]|uniref:hypothetical protein n=1 Tax=Mesorhizobium sp. WSM4982 TaxID=3038550 RepID=UPI0024157E27|nr:hypothetical protein [Mesorhizobium sp. WSM4982]MDG4856441.1 hypothetical protein [Mesorhizobium sp. WSM4982]
MATATPCYFSLSYGLAGCYMPDSHLGCYVVTTRRELVDTVREGLAFYDMPKSAIRQIKWSRLWSQAKRYGTSSIHFDIEHKGNALHFGGMTAAEYDAECTD